MSRRSVVPAFLFVCLLFSLIATGLLSPAHAAYWAVTYQCSGNNTGTSVNGQPINSPWVINPHMPNGSQGYGMWAQGTASGSITPTLTWTLNSGETVLPPAPKQIFVEMDTSASAHLGWTGTASGQKVQASDSLDGSGTPVLTAPGSEDCNVSGTHYLVVPNPTALTVVPLTSVSGTAVSSITAASSGAADFVGVKATVFPLIVTLGGAILDSSGNYNILVGQQCTSSLVGIPSGCTVSNWNWSVSGTKFQSWSASNSYTIEVDGLGATAYSTASWFWDDLKTATDSVTCTVTVTPPSGQGVPFSLTVTQPVKVVVPAWSCKGTGGNMQVNTSDGSGNGTDYWLYAGPASGSSTGRGMDWVASVTPPGAPFSGSGSLEMVQTETPNSTYTSSAGVTYTRSNNGQQGLDTSYAYPWQAPLPNPPSYESGDSPGLDLVGMASAQLKYSFVDTLMYEPPGDSQYVPIATFTWSTNGNAQLPATKSWADYGTGSAGAVTPGGTTNFTASIAFPAWAQNVGNGTWSWVAAKQ